MLGAGAGMLFALQSALTHTAVGGAFSGGILTLFTTWTTYAVAVTAILGTLLAQSAYEMAPLQASYPTLAAVEPLTGVALSIALLGGTLAYAPAALAGEAGGLAVMTAGIYLLASSPLVTAQTELDRQRQVEGRAYRTEDELERDLRQLNRDLDEIGESTSVRPGRARRTQEHLERDLDRVRSALGRLAELRDDIGRHRSAERAASQDQPPARQAEFDRHEAVLRTREREIDQRAEQLRRRADELDELASDARHG